MASEVTKVSVFDDRIVQQKPKYAVEKGALSLTNSPYSAISATTSQQTYNIIVPSENVFIDRAVDWSCDLFFSFTVTLQDETGATLTSGTPTAGLPICVVGRDVSLAPFPLHQCVNTMSATINDTTTTINTSDILPQLLRLTDYKEHRRQRTTPHQLDRYLNMPPSYSTTNSTVKGYEVALNSDEVPNGAFAKWVWTDQAGVPLAGARSGAQTVTPSTGQAYQAINGVPCFNGTANATGLYTLFARVTVTEKLVLPPFIFGDAFADSTGLFGVQNIQLVMNLQNPDRVLRNALTWDDNTFGAGATFGRASTKAISNVAYNNNVTAGAWQNCRVFVQYLTPALDVPLPPRSIVPYQEFPRYISPAVSITPYGGSTAATQAAAVIVPATAQTVTTQTITLPSIPDLLMIYVRPLTSTLTPRQGDYVLPIKSISVNFDNFSGLLSSHTQEQLYKMSVANGLDMDFSEWTGAAIVGVPTGQTVPGSGAFTGHNWAGGQFGTGLSTSSVTGLRVPLVGGPLLLKPGKDIVLQAGQAPGLVGNFTFQANLTVENYSPASAVNVYVVAINSGFFETIKGSSRIIKGVLTEQDIISAPSADATTIGHLRRLTGAGAMTADRAQMVANVMDSGKAKDSGMGAGGRRPGGMAAYC